MGSAGRSAGILLFGSAKRSALFLLALLLAAEPGSAGGHGRDLEIQTSISARSGSELLLLAPEAHAGRGTTFSIEGEAFLLTMGRATHASPKPLDLLGPMLTSAAPRDSPRLIGPARGTSATFGTEAVFAAYPVSPGAMRHSFEGAGPAKFSPGAPGVVAAEGPRWSESPGLAFRRELPEEHVLLAAGPGVHTLEGNFTVYLWDVTLTLVEEGESISIVTGPRRAPAVPVQLVEGWSWAYLRVTDGLLRVESASPAEARAPSFTVDVAGGALPATPGGGGLPAAGSYHVVPASGRLVVTEDRPLRAASVPPAVPGAAASFLPLAVALALAAGAACLAVWALVAARRRPRGSTPPAAPTPTVPGLLREGRAAVRSGDFKGAIPWFDLALRLDPRLAVAHLSRGLCFEALGRFEEAHRCYARAASCSPADGTVLYHYARSFLWAGLAAEALARLQLAIARDPSLAKKAREDPCFHPLADHPLFLALVGEPLFADDEGADGSRPRRDDHGQSHKA